MARGNGDKPRPDVFGGSGNPKLRASRTIRISANLPAAGSLICHQPAIGEAVSQETASRLLTG
jgi:hypothetical protein